MATDQQDSWSSHLHWVVPTLPMPPAAQHAAACTPAGAGGACGRMLYACRTEDRAPTLLVVPGEAYRAIPTATCPMPGQESSHQRHFLADLLAFRRPRRLSRHLSEL